MRMKYDAGRAKRKIEKLHATKVRFLTGFKTRIHGTDKQVGQVFPVGSMSGKRLPLMRAPKYHGINPLTPLELDTIHAEERMLQANLKGFTIGIRLKSGEIDEIPLIAKSWHEAFGAAQRHMQKYDPEDIDEITIVDPSLKEIAHAIAGGARRFAGAIKRGVEKIPRYAKKAEVLGLKAARKLGRIAAMPEEMKEAFAAGERERPWPEEGAVPTYEEEKEEALLSEARRLKRIGVAPEMYPEEYVRRPLTPTARAAKAELMRIDHEPAPFMPAYETEKLRLLREETAKGERRREAREEAEESAHASAIRRRGAAREKAHISAVQRGRLNGRSWRAFGVPLRSYMSAGQEE